MNNTSEIMNQNEYLVEDLDPLIFCQIWGLTYEVKMTTWERLDSEDKERIYQLKQQQEQRLINIPQVGDKVIWTNCHAHLSSWQPFVVSAIEGDYARLDFYAHPVPLNELEVCILHPTG